MKKQHLILKELDLQFLDNLLSKGSLNVRVQKRALALKKLHAGMSYKAVSELLEISYPTVLEWAKKYRSSGLDFLRDKPRSGRPIEYDGTDRAKVTALACSKPPKGYARWSIRLLSDRLVTLEILPAISYSQVAIILKKTNCNHIEKNNGVSEL